MSDLTVTFPGEISAQIEKWKVNQGSRVAVGTLLALYKPQNSDSAFKLRSSTVGTVSKFCFQEGDVVNPGDVVIELEGCSHPTVMKDMCAECGADLRQEQGKNGNKKEGVSASVAMVHSIPELIVSQQEADELGKADEMRLLKNRKLVLLVDLDQTLIHTTNDTIPPNLKDAYHFQLWHGRNLLWYHTKFRPGTKQFLEHISNLFELHICTFGARMYAHIITGFLDPDGKLFSHRILSRDECFNPSSKTANLRALFPRGDSMVCIIDDREDVWKFAPNLVHVKPYFFFDGTADINAPPGLAKTEPAEASHKHKSRLIRVPKRKSQDSEDGEPNAKKAKTSEQVETEDQSSEVKEQEEPESKSAGDIGQDEIISGKENEKSTKGSAEEEVRQTEMETDISEEKATDLQTEKSTTETASTPAEGSSENVTQPKTDSEVDAEKQVEMEVDGTVADDKTVSSEQEQEKNKEEMGTDKTDDLASDESKGDSSESKNEENAKDGVKQDLSQEKDKGEIGSTEKESGKEGKPMEEEEYEEMVEWEDNDDYLYHLEDILTRIHTAFYEVYDQLGSKNTPSSELPDLKVIIPYVRKKVLKGASIVFSGVIPIQAVPERSRIYNTATSLGATVQSIFVAPDEASKEEATTHLVAARPGTAKVKMAQKYKQVKVVSPDWLWNCSDRWEWVDERLFPLQDDGNWRNAQDSPDVSKMRKESSKRKAAEAEVESLPVYDPVTGKRIRGKAKKADAKKKKVPTATLR